VTLALLPGGVRLAFPVKRLASFYGTLHHIGQQHLKRYLAESDFRYNDRSALGINDKMRAAKAVKGVVGKRLTYHRPDEAAYAYAKGA
jgi:hypothetical protein